MKWGGRTQISRENALGRENKSRDSETGVKLACLENLARTPGGWNWMSRGEMAGGGARAAGRTRSWRVWVIPYIIIYDLITLSLKNTSQAELQASK